MYNVAPTNVACYCLTPALVKAPTLRILHQNAESDNLPQGVLQTYFPSARAALALS